MELRAQEPRPPGTLEAARGHDPEACDDREQQQRDRSSAAGREPQDLVVHAGSVGRTAFRIGDGAAAAEAGVARSAGCGQPPTRSTSPVSDTRRAAIPRLVNHDSAASPATIAAVDAVFAATHVDATTDTVRQGPRAGRPVR